LSNARGRATASPPAHPECTLVQRIIGEYLALDVATASPSLEQLACEQAPVPDRTRCLEGLRRHGTVQTPRRRWPLGGPAADPAAGGTL